MFTFSGIVQLIDRVPDSLRSLGSVSYVSYTSICGRGSSVPYDGENSFDVYTLKIEFSNNDTHKLEDFQSGTIVWVDRGKITTWQKNLGGREIWNVNLVAPISGIKAIITLPLGPSYEDHIRSGSNARKKA